MVTFRYVSENGDNKYLFSRADIQHWNFDVAGYNLLEITTSISCPMNSKDVENPGLMFLGMDIKWASRFLQ